MRAENLLTFLGIRNYTQRHLAIINEFIANKDTDLEGLLTKLGDWDTNDLKIAQDWFASVH